ncbi:MAG TPA: DUF2757 family protein [Bacillota bacterium]|jgi:hypothetical protein|nr:anti-sigma-F factor Fin family protein [Bacillota bacterium]HOB87040.1 DUF2757 family protein [Bacillota bacterium]HOP68617.1 DUF2757 family protein [Bacillota bacterium]HPT34586.1 DUF2757 family protein [Bacillota bacterium]HPZ64134.1 DUF2757 family protein [Bacillota bacterium]
MKLTYLCERCGAIIGAINLKSAAELQQLGLDPLTEEFQEDIIKLNDNEGWLYYSLCDDCVETMSLHEPEWPFTRATDLH